MSVRPRGVGFPSPRDHSSPCLEGVASFTDAAEKIDALWLQKLQFADSDISKAVNMCMRMAQYLECQAGFCEDPDEVASRRTATVYDVAHALQCTRRQWFWHHGLYVNAAPSRGASREMCEHV